MISTELVITLTSIRKQLDYKEAQQAVVRKELQEALASGVSHLDTRPLRTSISRNRHELTLLLRHQRNIFINYYFSR